MDLVSEPATQRAPSEALPEPERRRILDSFADALRRAGQVEQLPEGSHP
jgi:hypothetical protein